MRREEEEEEEERECIHQEQDIDLAVATLGKKDSLLGQVFQEYNSFGPVATNEKYQLNMHTQTSIRNLLLHCAPAALQEIQKMFNASQEAKTPFHTKVLETSRWLLGGVPPRKSSEPGGLWQEIRIMTAVKQWLFVRVLNFETKLAMKSGRTKQVDVTEWNQIADYACWAGYAVEQLKQELSLSWDSQVVANLAERIAEKDYWEKFLGHWMLMDTDFSKHDYPFWPEKQDGELLREEEDTALGEALHALSQEEADIQFKKDILALTTDQSNVIQHAAALRKSEKGWRIAKAAAIHNSMVQGRQLVVEPFMERHCQVVALEKAVAPDAEYRDFVRKHEAAADGKIHHIAIADGNKFGRMSDDELDWLIRNFKNIIDSNKELSVAILIVPTMASERRKRGDRDERQRIERKADAKNLDAFLCHVTMQHDMFHGNDNKRQTYDMYAFVSDDDELQGKNKFVQSWLLQRTCVHCPAAWLDPSQFYIPMSTPGSAMMAHDVSMEKRAAQLLGGMDVVRVLMESLLMGKSHQALFTQKDILLVSHWTPFDACVELNIARESRKPKSVPMHCISFTENSSDALACKARLLSILLKDWKEGTKQYIVESTVTFDDTPSEQDRKLIAAVKEAPKMKLCTWQGEVATLPQTIRKKWDGHHLFGEDWRRALESFDRALEPLRKGGTADTTPPTSVPQPPVHLLEGDWDIAPEEDIKSKHTIVKEVTTEFNNIIYLLTADNNLFAVARGGDGTIASEKACINHGPGDWVKPPHAEKLLTKDTEDKVQTFTIASDEDHVVLEIVPPQGRSGEDTDPTSWRSFLRDMESNGVTEAKIFGHSYKRPQGAMQADGDDTFIIESNIQLPQQWAWKPRDVKVDKAAYTNIASLLPIAQLLASQRVSRPESTA